MSETKSENKRDNNNNNNRRQNRNNNNRNNDRRQRERRTTTKQTNFKGKASDSEGHVFDATSTRQADQFATTKKEIEEHVGKNYDQPFYVAMATRDLKEPTMEMPELRKSPAKEAGKPDPAHSETELLTHKRECDRCACEKEKHEENKNKACSLAWGQCGDHARAKTEASADHKEASRKQDVIKLLIIIKNITFQHEDDKHEPMSLCKAMLNFFLLRQKEDMSDADFLEAFNNSVEVLEQIGGNTLGTDEILVNDDKTFNDVDPLARTVDDLTIITQFI